MARLEADAQRVDRGGKLIDALFLVECRRDDQYSAHRLLPDDPALVDHDGAAPLAVEVEPVNQGPERPQLKRQDV